MFNETELASVRDRSVDIGRSVLWEDLQAMSFASFPQKARLTSNPLKIFCVYIAKLDVTCVQCHRFPTRKVFIKECHKCLRSWPRVRKHGPVLTMLRSYVNESLAGLNHFCHIG